MALKPHAYYAERNQTLCNNSHEFLSTEMLLSMFTMLYLRLTHDVNSLDICLSKASTCPKEVTSGM